MESTIDMRDLVKYDPIKGVFVLKPQEQIQYWPGTKIQKSLHNVFNWQGQPSKLAKALKPANINPTPNNPRATFTIYTKAKKAQ